MATENELVKKFINVKKIENKLSKKMLLNVQKILDSPKENVEKIELIFNEFFEMYHLKKMSLVKDNK